MLKKTLMITLVILVMVGSFGCKDQDNQTISFNSVVDLDNLPEGVVAWVNSSLQTFGGQTLIDGENLYLLVTYGEKPTGGFSVEITEIVKEKDKLVVTANFNEPGKDEMVTQALTYPYSLVIIEASDLPVEFKATGAETSVTQ